MWLFFTRRLRTWLVLTVVVPLVSSVLRSAGLAVQRRGGPPAVSGALLKGGALAEGARRRFGPQPRKKRFGLF
ncbi:hypothetical protein GB931_19215 [Modestobacter sp. I12A-02628]|uniref:Uncharacterized protein n=1 Tax=Goekera deserti TaxID=2497753 RepID=A0A7K3WHF1_9ACTN|nr:hypothetical protein [Goekera deserti]MPR00010.1 hypothetical protein [Goekera deserti]NDI49788.1 hypothetical protein [Goekera deserti]NEL55150.1 hypothetical protein [Goekera deserti]